jgi:hypothetical protein
MDFLSEFRGSIPDGSTRTWRIYGVPNNLMVLWAVMPIAAQSSSRVSLDRVDVEHDGATNTHWLTISNDGSGNMIFDGVCVVFSGTLS